MLENGIWSAPSPDMPDGDYLTATRVVGSVRIEIAPWRHGEYQGVFKMAEYAGIAKVLCVMPIPELPEDTVNEEHRRDLK